MRAAALLVSILCVQVGSAEEPWSPAPRSREYPWMSTAVWRTKHQDLVRRSRDGKVDVLFLGDSITEGWNNNAVWKQYYAPRKAANYGIGGDKTQNVLWRVMHGELEGIRPQIVVLLIGTNNFGLHNDTAEDVARGVSAVVKAIRQKLPESKILLLAIFPRDARPQTGFRTRIKEANRTLARLDDGKRVRFLDLAPRLLERDGSLSPSIMPDFLHLTEKGYQAWAEGMEPLMKEMLETEKVRSP